ncbi:MAG TPA: hypothetical protein VEH27_10870 [Methylomirabilota bacterium]|nr:hypothetical protein [Methylomirabilota bacterium]
MRIFRILAAVLVTVATLMAHSENEIGPHGGKILEFSTDQSVHGEVTMTNGMFHVLLLDKEMKPMALTDESIVVTGGSRSNPEKPKVEKQGNQFMFPALKGDNYLLVFQFRSKPASKPVTARFEYNAAKCGACKKPEWLCVCGAKK